MEEREKEQLTKQGTREKQGTQRKQGSQGKRGAHGKQGAQKKRGKKNKRQKQNQNKSPEIEDRVLKVAMEAFGEEMLQYLGQEGKVLRAVPTEQVHLELRKMMEDFNFEMEDKSWRHYEFESDRIFGISLSGQISFLRNS